MDARRRTMVLGGVMVAHVLLLQLWIMASAKQGLSVDRWPTVEMRLLPLEVERSQARSERFRPAAPWRPSVSIRPVPDLGDPVPAEGRMVESTGAAGESRAGRDATERAAGGESGPLRLGPSREAVQGAFANPAVVDPRANSPRPDAMERMAMAIDRGNCLVVERMADGSDRKRWGRYVEMVPAITQQTGLAGKPVRVCVG
ncbi:MAG: hypothetical protein J7598_24425 [Mitsuaria chitosanitabida]|uniref:hypothetical protein n=1 Tax=Roseateles chitosanitabidus TaxID=65048 RepID=UPI001B06B08A|nr:hypothetical protein [Roseateles chitosanitabidus]MBO9689761.1 hypothetical protein [Roseateles chitosanitabidus]